MQALQLIIFAVLAAVVLYQLYAVLGRRVGRQPEDVAEDAAEQVRAPAPEPADRPETAATYTIAGASLTGLSALTARDPSFNTSQFLAGSRKAYEMIVTAFAERDRETLKSLLSSKVLQGFERVMADRESKGETETVEFLHAPRADLDGIEVKADKATIRVRFLAEHRVRTRGDEGEGVEDRRTAEIWSFERNLNSRDPNWILVRVDAAEA